MKRKAPLNRIHIRFGKLQGFWFANGPDGTPISNSSEKNLLILSMQGRCQDIANLYGIHTSLVIHRKNGTIQEERTYPLSRDPKRSKG